MFSGLYPKAKSHFFTQDGYIKENFSYICSITFTAFTISQLIVRDNKIYSRSYTAVIVQMETLFVEMFVSKIYIA